MKNLISIKKIRRELIWKGGLKILVHAFHMPCLMLGMLLSKADLICSIEQTLLRTPSLDYS